MRFDPELGHPLDGILHNTKGVVDSRFNFNVDITARTHKVTTDTRNATINDVTFHFDNVTDRG